ncbi:MAG: BamA/TamA family outer membrane protein, partial [Spirochaetes bacterium]|nr:BamA/TamA family outer membrane protein [Spirochaetota bacterium]
FSLEYRIPIHEQFVWLAGFVDMVNLLSGPTVGGSYDEYETWKFWNEDYAMLWENWYGSVGFGIQLTIPQLPLSFYVVKRFKVNYHGGFEWVGTSPTTGNLDFVLSIVGMYF